MCKRGQILGDIQLQGFSKIPLPSKSSSFFFFRNNYDGNKCVPLNLQEKMAFSLESEISFSKDGHPRTPAQLKNSKKRKREINQEERKQQKMNN